MAPSSTTLVGSRPAIIACPQGTGKGQRAKGKRKTTARICPPFSHWLPVLMWRASAEKRRISWTWVLELENVRFEAKNGPRRPAAPAHRAAGWGHGHGPRGARPHRGGLRG